MSAYFLVQVQVTDQEKFSEYTKLVGAILDKFGAEVLAKDSSPNTVEGSWPEGRTVLIRFDNMEKAKAWYNSDEYQEISKIRRASSESNMVFVEGLSNG